MVESGRSLRDVLAAPMRDRDEADILCCHGKIIRMNSLSTLCSLMAASAHDPVQRPESGLAPEVGFAIYDLAVPGEKHVASYVVQCSWRP
jgi:hypothetical protein